MGNSSHRLGPRLARRLLAHTSFRREVNPVSHGTTATEGDGTEIRRPHAKTEPSDGSDPPRPVPRLINHLLPPFHPQGSIQRLTSHEEREGRRNRDAKSQTQTLGDAACGRMGAAEAPALAAAPAAGGGVGGEPLERRVMAAVKASEARGDPPLLRAVEISRLVAGEPGAGVPSADLAGILVSNLCFAHNSPSLWKLLDQAMSSRLLCPLHVLALLTARSAPVPARFSRRLEGYARVTLWRWFLQGSAAAAGAAGGVPAVPGAVEGQRHVLLAVSPGRV